MKQLILSAGLLALTSTLMACGGGGGGGGPTLSAAPSFTPAPADPNPQPAGPQLAGPAIDGTVQISGAVTFDSVPHNSLTHGLDYSAMHEKPARGVSVQLLGSDDTVLALSETDGQGHYNFTVAENTDVRVRVLAQMQKSASSNSGGWDVSVSDNTQGDAGYVLQGALSSSGAQNQIRNLAAGSGWDLQTGAYTGARAAAPFAILDPIYDGIQKFAVIDTAMTFPPLTVYWSENNIAVASTRSSAAIAEGNIGTSFYEDASIYVLGAASSDTDEYDSHVIVHEWAHYIEDTLARADSIGGNHGGADRLDPRVALSEGLGNAISAMILDDPVYRDSGGGAQAYGFSIDVDNNSYANTGWFNEGSVQSILYDIYDSGVDGVDELSLGLAPIHAVLIDNDYVQSEAFATIYSFSDLLKSHLPASANDIDKLLLGQSIYGRGAYGIGESNTGGVADSLPVYRQLSAGAAPVQICSHVEAGSFNKLGNRSFLQLDIASSGIYRLTMERSNGDQGRNPDFYIYKAGGLVGSANTAFSNQEIWEGALEAGTYIIDAHDRNNVINISVAQGAACYNFSVTQ